MIHLPVAVGVGGTRQNGIAGWELGLEMYAAEHLMRLDCPASRENFYKRHGFHRLFTASEGVYVYMAGPAESKADVQHLCASDSAPAEARTRK